MIPVLRLEPVVFSCREKITANEKHKGHHQQLQGNSSISLCLTDFTAFVWEEEERLGREA